MQSRKGHPRKRASEAQSQAAVDIGFGPLFKGLGDFVGVLGKLVEAGEQQINQTGEFKVKGLGEKAHGVYGVSVRVGIGGEPHVERFGNIRATKEGPEVVDVREPLIDVFDEEKEIVVAAELPGVTEDAINIDVRGDVLALSSSGERRYAKELLLPSAVDAASMRRSFKNGLLELRLKKS
ncbi:MAG: Hsp20/alpha crystallin family protein [Hyphomicrobiaceae bacterium]|nr:MAG: Hsp20/alpha crystallin family protein [Hyphomicrobiaceae bacterium]